MAPAHPGTWFRWQIVGEKTLLDYALLYQVSCGTLAYLLPGCFFFIEPVSTLPLDFLPSCVMIHLEKPLVHQVPSAFSLACPGKGSQQRKWEKTMSKTIETIHKANQWHAANFGEKGKLPMPPARRLAILTCMDARLDPAKFAGLQEGDAHVIRNAGGRATEDAIRSLVISYKLLGTREWLVIHHTNCGMETFTDEVMRSLLSQSLETATLTENGWKDTGKGEGSTEGSYIDWLTIGNHLRDLSADVRRIRNHPLVPRDIPIYGYIYDVKTGHLQAVPEAMELGKSEGSQASKAQGA
jgi:carbonic anhydrase